MFFFLLFTAWILSIWNIFFYCILGNKKKISLLCSETRARCWRRAVRSNNQSLTYANLWVSMFLFCVCIHYFLVFLLFHLFVWIPLKIWLDVSRGFSVKKHYKTPAKFATYSCDDASAPSVMSSWNAAILPTCNWLISRNYVFSRTNLKQLKLRIFWS